jgi:hypothetical protein
MLFNLTPCIPLSVNGEGFTLKGFTLKGTKGGKVKEINQ